MPTGYLDYLQFWILLLLIQLKLQAAKKNSKSKPFFTHTETCHTQVGTTNLLFPVEYLKLCVYFKCSNVMCHCANSV